MFKFMHRATKILIHFLMILIFDVNVRLYTLRMYSTLLINNVIVNNAQLPTPYTIVT